MVVMERGADHHGPAARDLPPGPRPYPQGKMVPAEGRVIPGSRPGDSCANRLRNQIGLRKKF